MLCGELRTAKGRGSYDSATGGRVPKGGNDMYRRGFPTAGCWVGLIGVIALGSAGCGGSASPGRSAAHNYLVNEDGGTRAFNGSFTAFFPDRLAAHPGDTVTVRLPQAYTGQPHTVTLGTLVDAAVARLEKLGPTASLAAIEHSREWLRLPDAYPHEVSPKVPEANQSAAQPCYLDHGVPPLSLTGGAPACPKRAQPAFNGTQSFYNSGVLEKPGASYTVHIAKDTKPGTYGVVCLLHRSAGIAQISVVPRRQPVPSPSQATARGNQQFRHLVSVLKPVAAKAARAKPSDAVAGAVAPNIYSALVAQFGPRNISIPVGGTVTWHLNGFHSITFGAKDQSLQSLVQRPDGSVHFSQKANFPAGYHVPNLAFTIPPPDNGHPIVIDGGRWDGSGFRSTGIVGSFAPVLITVKQTFTKAGTYTYRCLLHPGMRGVIKVG